MQLIERLGNGEKEGGLGKFTLDPMAQKVIEKLYYPATKGSTRPSFIDQSLLTLLNLEPNRTGFISYNPKPRTIDFDDRIITECAVCILNFPMPTLSAHQIEIVFFQSSNLFDIDLYATALPLRREGQGVVKAQEIIDSPEPYLDLVIRDFGEKYAHGEDRDLRGLRPVNFTTRPTTFDNGLNPVLKIQGIAEIHRLLTLAKAYESAAYFRIHPQEAERIAAGYHFLDREE